MPTNDDVYTILGMTMNMYGVEELMIGRKNIVSMHLILTAYCLFTASFNDFWVENEINDGIQAQSLIEQAFLIPKM